jgi:hypothetical protein
MVLPVYRLARTGTPVFVVTLSVVQPERLLVVGEPFRVAVPGDQLWPVKRRMRDNGVDVDRFLESDFGGIRSHLAAKVTPTEIDAVVAAILGR